MYYGEEQKLGFLQYEELFYDLLSRLVCNQQYLEDNQAYFEQIVFKTYERYANSTTESYSIRQIVTITEICIDAMLKYKPSLDLPDDIITIH